MFEALTGKKPKIPQSAKPVTRALSNGVLRQVVGKRFVIAREINGWQQSEAAALMGYKNSTQLSLIEQGKRLPPPTVMLEASRVFSVSMDFLYGVSDEPERDAQTAEQAAMIRHMEDVLRANAEAVGTALMVHVRRGGSSMLALQGLHAAAIEQISALRRLQELSGKKFDGMRGGATVLAALVKLECEAAGAGAILQRTSGLREHLIKTAEAKAGIDRPLFDGSHADRMAA